MSIARYHGVEFRVESTDEGWSYRYEVEGQEQIGTISPTIDICAVRQVWGMIDRDLRRIKKAS